MTIATYNSVDRIIRMAMYDAGLLEEGADPVADQSGNNIQRLLDMIQVWQLEGCKLFLMRDVIMPLTLNVGTYSIGPAGTIAMPRPTRVEEVYMLDPGGSKRPITPVSLADWSVLPSAENNGTITQYYEDRQISSINLSFWNKPGAQDVAGKLHIVVRAAVGTFSSISDPITTSFPIEWAMALRWGLAADLCTGQPDAIVNRCEQNAQRYKTVLEGFDVESGGITLQPDLTGYPIRSRFS